jgi:hypothetical protein
MQPYFFPYIGYFNLIHAVDTLVFYDDVAFAKNKFIYKNRIISKGAYENFSMALSKKSQSTLLKDLQVHDYKKNCDKLLKKIRHSYSKRPYFEFGMNYLNKVFETKYSSMIDFNINSITELAKILNMHTNFLRSSQLNVVQNTSSASDRIINIIKSQNAHLYCNLPGGVGLYDKNYFKNFGLELEFIRPIELEYNQKNTEKFISSASIIDVLMNISIDDIKTRLMSYEKF